MRAPTNGKVTFPFGATTAPYSPSNPHAGVDFGAAAGDPVFAPHAGKVTISGSLGDCGIAVEIDGGRFRSRLCHNSSSLVSVGQNVTEGQQVAKAGATGAAIGVHCHWVLWDNGVRVDGSKYVVVPSSQMIEPATVRSLSKDFRVPLTDSQVEYYSKHPGGYTELFQDFLKYNYDIRKQLEAGLNYEPVSFPVYKKKGT